MMYPNGMQNRNDDYRLQDFKNKMNFGVLKRVKSTFGPSSVGEVHL